MPVAKSKRNAHLSVIRLRELFIPPVLLEQFISI